MFRCTSFKQLIRSPGQLRFLLNILWTMQVETNSVKRTGDGKKLSLIHCLLSAPSLTALLITRLFLLHNFLSLTKGVFWPIHSITIIIWCVFQCQTSHRWEQSCKSGLDNLLYCLVSGYNCQGINTQFSKARVVFWPCQWWPHTARQTRLDRPGHFQNQLGIALSRSTKLSKNV